jgi:hypothetical protein
LNELLPLLREGIRRTRQHHAIEHATLHLLAERYPQRSFIGYSDPVGFFVFGNVEPFALRRTVSDALLRLRAGETQLAIHANCGTVLASTATITALAALMGSSGKRGVGRFTAMLTWTLGALVISRPLGLRLQRYTTLADVGDRWLVDVRQMRTGKTPIHRVLFE